MIAYRLTDDMRRKLVSAFDDQRICLFRDMPLCAGAFLAWVLRDVFRRTVVTIADTSRTQDAMLRNLAAFAGDNEKFLLSYPARDDAPSGAEGRDMDIAGERMNALNRVIHPREPLIIATCVHALLQTTLHADAFTANTHTLILKHNLEPGLLLSELDRAGYDIVPETREKGQASRRGGILDVWPPTEEMPIRVEFLGSTVETIRSFDPADQRSLERKGEALLSPADELKVLRENRGAPTSFISHLAGETIYFWFNCAPYGAALDSESSFSMPLNAVMEMIEGNPRARQCMSAGIWTGRATEKALAPLDMGFRTVPLPPGMNRELFEPDLLAEQRRTLLNKLAQLAIEGVSIHIFFGARGALDRFAETHPATPFRLRHGFVSDGFINSDMRIAVIGESLLTGQPEQTRKRCLSRASRPGGRRLAKGQTVTDWTGIQPGDLVVHLDHGIGRYLGIYQIVFNGQPSETLAVEYAGGAKLYVPVSQAHLLSRYIGSGRHPPQLHRLGGGRWKGEREAAERAVEDLASSMLQLQAVRESMEGFSFPPDGEWQQGFEAAFPYEETPDQAEAIAQVKADMESVRPMDRLVCGDVGYGKTEIALRAAFKAVTAGKQVALLVPTTVLAQQHFEVFLERMGAYPFNIELLCRFRTRAQQEQAVLGLSRGAVDIVIGTHRLLQNDVQFKDLGLVIIDEEQRFGVVHKERLKHMRQLVDVLTLTATPIPRTLYMSLVGARDISMIQTPPEERLPIETVVAPREDRVVRDAIGRELARGGQVYYLHNRISSIERVYEWLCSLVPEARIAIGHGQTPRTELSSIMREFERGRFDVLLCTTIIQSGVDIPNVNTILIDRADRFGMADLHQLRGRVGRSGRKAYAYLLLPDHGGLMADVGQRIRAVLQHSELGAGFQLAMRDLEIRGAGNLLGRDQSGHIAAIGFELYCQLLKRTIAQLSESGTKKSRPSRIVDTQLNLDFIQLSSSDVDGDNSACVPESYVDDEHIRLSMYRKIASSSEPEDIDALRDEFRDRFGPVPGPLDRLLKMATIRIIASSKDVTSIESKEGKIMLKKNGDFFMPAGRFPRLRSAHADEMLDEIIRWLKRLDDPVRSRK